VFEDSEDEAPAIVEEFFPEVDQGDSSNPVAGGTTVPAASAQQSTSPHTRPNRVTPRLGKGGSGHEQ